MHGSFHGLKISNCSNEVAFVIWYRIGITIFACTIVLLKEWVTEGKRMGKRRYTTNFFEKKTYALSKEITKNEMKKE